MYAWLVLWLRPEVAPQLMACELPELFLQPQSEEVSTVYPPVSETHFDAVHWFFPKSEKFVYSLHGFVLGMPLVVRTESLYHAVSDFPKRLDSNTSVILVRRI